jgi:dTDP-4-amino-4,6-dideoxygalactose transaminase
MRVDGELRFPVFDGAAEYAAHQDEFDDAALRVLRSGRYILGDEVEAFEEGCARWLDAAHVVSCGSGTDALWLALRGLSIGPGDSVLTSAFTFFATVSAILACGATPVLCDIDPETFAIDPERAEEIFDGRTAVDPGPIRAILPVHLYGQPADLDALAALGLPIIEDAAQAFGATYRDRQVSTLGAAGCHSFFPTKNLGGFGDGGLVVCPDAELAGGLRSLRAHGSTTRYVHEVAGTNSRLDAVQAALLGVRLRHLDTSLKARRAIALAYDDALVGSTVVTPVRATDREHSFNLYVIRVPSGRADAASRLRDAGIGTAVHYPLPVHLQPALRHLGYSEGDFPEAERAAREVLTLPMYPSLGTDAAAEIGAAVASATAPR